MNQIPPILKHLPEGEEALGIRGELGALLGCDFVTVSLFSVSTKKKRERERERHTVRLLGIQPQLHHALVPKRRRDPRGRPHEARQRRALHLLQVRDDLDGARPVADDGNPLAAEVVARIPGA